MKIGITEISRQIPYEQFDPNVVGLIIFLNSFPGIYTTGSCGGHAKPKPGQSPENEWIIFFKLEFTRRGVATDSWVALEFLVWACNNNLRRAGYNVRITAFSAPPYLNEIGQTLTFSMDGRDVEPDLILERLKKLRLVAEQYR